MKKIIIAFTLVLFCISLSAQLGIRAGLNNASMKFNLLGLNVETDSKIGFHAGLTYDLSVGNNLTLRPGVLYSTKGYKITENSEDIIGSFNYLEIPIHLVYKFGEDATKGFFISGGPSIGLLMSAEAEGEDVKEESNSTDLGFNLGVGYMINSNISVGLDYTTGLSNVSKTDPDIDLDTTVKHAVGSLYILYKI